MPYLGSDRNLVAQSGLSVMVGSGFTVAWRLGFLVICRSGGRGTAGTKADDQSVIPHASVNGITLASWDHCYGTMAKYCFHDASLRSSLEIFCTPNYLL